MYDADRNLTPDQAVELVERLLLEQTRRATAPEILAAVEAETGVPTIEMLQRCNRRQHVAHARSIVVGCLRDISRNRWSYPEIARGVWRCRHHSTASAAYKRWLALPDHEQILERVRARIVGGGAVGSGCRQSGNQTEHARPTGPDPATAIPHGAGGRACAKD